MLVIRLSHPPSYYFKPSDMKVSIIELSLNTTVRLRKSNIKIMEPAHKNRKNAFFIFSIKTNTCNFRDDAICYSKNHQFSVIVGDWQQTK